MKWNSFNIVEELAIVGLSYVHQKSIRQSSYTAYFHKHGGTKIGDTVGLPVTAGGDMYMVGQNEDFKVASNVNEFETFLNVRGKINRIHNKVESFLEASDYTEEEQCHSLSRKAPSVSVVLQEAPLLICSMKKGLQDPVRIDICSSKQSSKAYGTT